MRTQIQRRRHLPLVAAAVVGLALSSPAPAQPPTALEFLPGVLEMAADPPPEYRLETLCQVHSVPEGEEPGYYTVLGIDGRTAFIVAYSPHELRRPWENMTLRGQFVPVGKTTPIDEGTADWAYVFDRNGDGRIDFLAYRVGPLWILPEGVRERDLPSVRKGVLIDFFEANRDKLGQGFWFQADENYDGHADGLIARVVDEKSGWADGWLLTWDADFDRAFETCTWTEGRIDAPARKCRKTKDGYAAPGHAVAGLTVVPLPGPFPLESFNAALASCEFGAERLYAAAVPAWADYVPPTIDFAAQPEEQTRRECYERTLYGSCRYLAERDDAKAQVWLGSMFASGRGVEHDDAQAAQWLRRAADAGDAEGQFRLGLAYAVGIGVGQDAAEAARWYRLAAEQDHAAAQFMLGQAHQAGAGVPEDVDEAVAWYRKSAVQGHADAQYALGVCSARGLGMAKDDAAAVEWYRKAAEQGSARAQFSLASCYWDGQGVARDYPESIAWLRKAAEQGLGIAEYHLGIRYLAGMGLSEDVPEGIRWIERAARRGVTNAQVVLGARYVVGDGVPKNVVLGYAWIRVAELNGHPTAGEGRRLAGKMLSRQQREAAEKLAQQMLGP